MCLKGLESVGGFAGRRVGGAAILVEFTRGMMGEEPPMTDAVLSIPESLLLDLRLKRLKEGIFWLIEDVLVVGMLLYGELGDQVEGS